MSFTAFTNYLSLEKNFSEHTVTAYKKDILSFTSFCKEEYDLDSIDKINYTLIRSWIVSLVTIKLTNRTINRKVASLKAYYKFLHQIGKIDKNPLSNHKALKTAKKVEVPFSQSEMETVLNQITFGDDYEGKRDQLIIELLYTTGMRRAELVNLKVTDVNIASNLIKVLGKRNKERIIPLLPSTKSMFISFFNERSKLPIIADEQFVFLLKSGIKIYNNLVYRVIIKYLGKVSTKVKKSPHILRHTFATHLLTNGADLNSVKELLGHSSLASTQVYTHNSIAELKKVHSTSHPRSKK